MSRTSKSSSNRRQHVEGIFDTVQQGLCHRCGGCIGICPSGTLDLDEDCFPKQVDECTRCSLCTDICSGPETDYQQIGRWLFGKQYQYVAPLGMVREGFVGYSTEDAIRWRGASGGVVTKLILHLLETEQIQGALVAGPHPDDAALGLGYIARNREELLGSTQSRYTTTPMLTALKEIQREKGKFAFVALPCHAYTLRKLQMKSEAWKNRIHLIIGLYCHYRLPHEATREAAAILAPENTQLIDINYRQKDERGWPYNTVEMTFSDQSKWRSPYGPAQTVSLLAHCFPRGRCLYCIDALVEFADLAVGDPWIRDIDGEWKYSAPGGMSGIIVRTETGSQVLEESSNSGALVLKSIPPDEVVEGQRIMIMEKARSAPVRMKLLKLFLRRPMPEYNIEYEPITLKRLFHEIKFGLMRTITIWPMVRQFFVRLGFSAMGRKFMKRRRQRNKERAIARLAAKR